MDDTSNQLVPIEEWNNMVEFITDLDQIFKDYTIKSNAAYIYIAATICAWK